MMSQATDNLDLNKDELINNWQHVGQQIVTACQKASENGRKVDASGVTLLAVSKTKPAAMIAALAQAGQRDFGENYLQEAIGKIIELKNEEGCQDLVWHYIGSIQRNKTRDIAEHFAWVQTLERDIIAKRLNDQRPENLPPLNVLIQVNIDEEESKSGCHPREVDALVNTIKAYPKLNLRGLMIIPDKAGSDAFDRTQQLFSSIKTAHPELEHWDTLSMGMSGDMEDAITHGSTMVRVGTAIFGARS